MGRVGKRLLAALMALCTSLAAPSASRSKSNCKITWVWPRLLLDVSSVMPAIRPMARSKGMATVAAMVSGLAPGWDARTIMTGKSTWGKGATGNLPKATRPAKVMAMVRRVVATGRTMNKPEKVKLKRAFGLGVSK